MYDKYTTILIMKEIILFFFKNILPSRVRDQYQIVLASATQHEHPDPDQITENLPNNIQPDQGENLWSIHQQKNPTISCRVSFRVLRFTRWEFLYQFPTHILCVVMERHDFR